MISAQDHPIHKDITMTTPSMARKLNAQMNLEFSASQLYVTLSNWCMERNLTRIALCLRHQAQTGITHTMRVFDYIKQTGRYPIIKSVNISTTAIHSIDELLQKAVENQLMRYQELACLAEAARVETDNTALNLLSAIYDEQKSLHEELITQMNEYSRLPVTLTR